ncbi:hypothetical protein B0J12DRAFT_754102, partial [Macrophomina phaseolina]
CTPLPSSPPRPPSSLSHLRAPSLRLPSALTSPRLGDSGRSPTSPSMIPRRATASASSSGGTTATPAPTTPGIAARPARDTATISPLLYRRTGRIFPSPRSCTRAVLASTSTAPLHCPSSGRIPLPADRAPRILSMFLSFPCLTPSATAPPARLSTPPGSRMSSI